MLLITLTNSLLYSNVTVRQHAQYKELKSKQLKELRVKFNYIGKMLKKKDLVPSWPIIKAGKMENGKLNCIATI